MDIVKNNNLLGRDLCGRSVQGHPSLPVHNEMRQVHDNILNWRIKNNKDKKIGSTIHLPYYGGVFIKN